MNILLTLSKKKFHFHQHSDSSIISINNQYIKSGDKIITSELPPFPKIFPKINGAREEQEEDNLVKKNVAAINLEDLNTPIYVNSGFNSKIPPSLSIIYNISGMCWLISVLENFKSNEELRKYIFKNCKNDNFLKVLRRVFEIHQAEISEQDFKSLMSIYPKHKPTRSSGGDALLFMTNLMENCFSRKITEGLYQYIKSPFFQIPSKLKGNETTFGFRSHGGMPFIQICVPQGFFKYYYLDIGNIFPSFKSSLPSSNDQYGDIVLNRKANFLIIGVYYFGTNKDKSIDFKGIVIPKTLFIATKNRKKEKYLLTGVSYSQKTRNKQFNHAVTYVKRDNQWYDTDYEEAKDTLGFFSRFFYKQSSLIDVLNDTKKEEIILETAEHKRNPISKLLFYQIEE